MKSRLIGALFVLASAAAIAGGSLIEAGGHAASVTGALLEVVLAGAVIAIAALLWSVLRHASEPGAAAYLAVRTLEGMLIVAGAIAALVMRSQPGASTGREWAYLLGTVVVFGASAVILNFLLLRDDRVPSWLAWWGLVGGALLVLRGVVETYGVNLPVAVQIVLAAPIGIQEMVFAVRLIVRPPVTW
ncbi:DUF4386 domain-containing protein [Actinoplanes bogorensis]|uniref:DUF4386 domain-containing protein n=1 Tax=Paractinoplanes bogorensis TaxID=1610840 RepID=A0ABS5YG96_9ACTN|nr:DUF4386 domain-containing protein [Actinoplanes bogorensis]MBU2662465.1 DUF4386 domain-containing protein [Actinoplanes bogorensis]